MTNTWIRISVVIIAGLGAILPLIWKSNNDSMDIYRKWVLVIFFVSVIILSVVAIVLDRQSEKENKSIIEKQKAQLDSIKKGADLLENIGNAQLRAAMYTSSLDEPIKTIEINLILDKEYSFNDLCPIRFCCLIFKSNLGKEIQELRYIAKDELMHSSSKGNQVRVDSYLLTLLDKENNEIHKSHFGYCSEKLSSIKLPIYYQGQKNKLLYKSRDFHDSIFHIYLTKKLLDKIARIQFIVNKWAIVNSDPKDVFWIDKQVKWSDFEDSIILKDAQTTDPKSKGFPRNPWHLNLYWHIPLFLE